MSAPIDDVFAAPGVVAVVDAGEGYLVESRGFADDDVVEVVKHFTETWSGLVEVLLPVMDELVHGPWIPGRWWACAGGDRVAVGRQGRFLIVEAAQAGPYLLAVSGDGTAANRQIWD
jgi:roadblock/LC7 domain-containing protein